MTGRVLQRLLVLKHPYSTTGDDDSIHPPRYGVLTVLERRKGVRTGGTIQVRYSLRTLSSYLSIPILYIKDNTNESSRLSSLAPGVGSWWVLRHESSSRPLPEPGRSSLSFGNDEFLSRMFID